MTAGKVVLTFGYEHLPREDKLLFE